MSGPAQRSVKRSTGSRRAACGPFALGPFALGIIALAPVSRAALLVSEPFAYGSSQLNLDGQSATGTGLTGTYSRGSSGLVTDYLPASLAFSDYATSGGRLLLSAVNSTGTSATGNFGVGLSASVPAFTGTLYSSYLVSITDLNGISAQAVVNANSGQNAASGTSWFRSAADYVNNSSFPGIAYNATGAAVGTASNSSPLTVDDVFLVVSKFTLVNTGSNGGVATMYVLSADQYADWMADGGTESLLDGRATGTGAQNSWGRMVDASGNLAATFDSSTFLQYAMNTGTTVGTLTVEYDELRFATTFAELVPEPGSLGLLAIAGLMLRRRRWFIDPSVDRFIESVADAPMNR